MSQRIDFNGEIHEFPDDFTDQDISAALGGSSVPQESKEKQMTEMALGSQAKSPLAALTGYGANVIGTIPGLKEAGSAIAAGLGAGEGETFSKRYENLEQAQQAMRTAGSQLYPNQTMLGKGASYLTQMATVPTTMNPLSNMTLGAAYGASDGDAFKSGEEAAKERLVRGGAGAALAGAIPMAISGAGNIARGIAARTPEKLQSAVGARKSGATELYQKMRDVGAVFNENKTLGILSDIENGLSKVSFIPELNPKTKAVVDKIWTEADNGTLGLDQLDQYRRLLRRIAPTEDGVSAGNVIKELDKAVSSAGASDFVKSGRDAVAYLEKGRKEYFKASKFEDLSDVIIGAGGDQQKIKSALTRFVNKPENLYGLPQDVINEIRSASRTGIGEGLLKLVGVTGINMDRPSFMGSFMPAAAGIGATSLGTPYALPVVAAGTLAKQAGKYIARGKAEKALRAVEEMK